MVSEGLLIVGVTVGIMLVFVLMGNCNALRCRKLPQVKRPWRMKSAVTARPGD